jgi:hypothetical protein
MTMRPFASTRVVASAALIALVAGMAGGLAACDTRSSSDRAIEKASNEIYGLTGGGTVAAPNSSTKQSMESVIAGVQDATNDESKSRAAAAQLLTAQAQLALGEQPAAEAMALDRETRGGFDRAVGLLSSWSALNAGASAAESFDPSSTIADLTKSIEAKRGETQEQRAQLTRINEQIAKLERERQGFLKTAEDLQSQYASQMDAIRGQSAMSSAQAVEKAQEIWRKAEKARLDAARLTAQIEVLGPEAQSRQMVAEQTERQIEDLTNAIEELRTQRQARTQAANQSRDDAQKVAATLDQSVFDASKRLTDEVIPAYDKAIGVFGKAASASQAAEGASPAAGRVSTGAARQSIAELNWMKAQALAYQGRVLGALSKAQPSLPNASDYANRAKASMDGAKEALTAANQAFTQAQSAFAGAPAQAASRERLQKLGELLGKAAEITEGKALDLGSSFGFQSISTPPERDRVGEVRLAAESYYNLVREGRFDEAAQQVTGDEETVAQYRASMEMASGAARLDNAIQAKFPGKTLNDALGSLSQMGLNSDALKGVQDVSAMNFKANDNGTVDVTSEMMPMPMTFREVDGQWKLDVNSLKPMLEQAGAMLEPFKVIFGELATEVEEGKYENVEAVGSALTSKLQAAMMGAMGGMGG